MLGSENKAKIMSKKPLRGSKTSLIIGMLFLNDKKRENFNARLKYICKTLTTKTSIRYRKKTKIPKRNEQQKAAVQARCARLYQNYQNRFWTKQENPANLPKCLLIEDFWNILKAMAYKNNWQSKNRG